MYSVLALFATAATALDNGRSVTPPMGWRSWNLYGGNVNQVLISGIMTGMVDKSRSVNGVPTSLKDLGYIDVGLDDNWQLCGHYGPDKYTFHSPEGRPLVNPLRFPDFQNMTNYAHSLGLTAGWYGNNCICSDHCSTDACYQGDVDSTLDYGFDSIKLDGCGAQRDLDKYAALFNATGKAILIENCHWGGTVPNATWCPWNYFRTSGDVAASYDSVVGNLQTTIQWAKGGLSKPGCWGYPDMLEVGCAHGPHGAGDPGLNDFEMYAHFGAWCIVSSPLILSHDVNNQTVMDRVWPLISNKEAIAVNQAWAGFSGSVFLSASGDTVNFKSGAVPAWQYWNKPVGGGNVAVLMMNHASSSATLTLPLAQVPDLNSANAKVRDIWAQKDLGTFQAQYTVTLASHQSAFLMLSAA